MDADRSGRRQILVGEDHYRSLFENIPICIHEIDLNGALVSMNPAGLETYNPVRVDGRYTQHTTTLYGQFQAATGWTRDDVVAKYGVEIVESGFRGDHVAKALEVDGISAASTEVRFATSVAAFGQLLRGGRFTGTYSYDDVIKLAQGAKGEDHFGYRAEFINLVRLAKTVAALQPLKQ